MNDTTLNPHRSAIGSKSRSLCSNHTSFSRLAGTVLSGAAYQAWGLTGCLWISSAFLITAAILSIGLPATRSSHS